MMIVMIIMVSLAFLWLMIESKWLTIRLPQYYREPIEKFAEAVIDIVPLIIVASLLFGVIRLLGNIKPPRAKASSPNFLKRLLNKLGKLKIRVWGSPLP